MRERHSHSEVAQPKAENTEGLAFERHFTSKELAAKWALDESTVRRLFIDEPGVLKIGKSNRRDGKRDYVSLRIPESVAVQLHWQRSQ